MQPSLWQVKLTYFNSLSADYRELYLLYFCQLPSLVLRSCQKGLINLKLTFMPNFQASIRAIVRSSGSIRFDTIDQGNKKPTFYYAYFRVQKQNMGCQGQAKWIWTQTLKKAQLLAFFQTTLWPEQGKLSKRLR